MSAPAVVACAAAAVCLGLPVVAAAAHLERQQRADVTADAAALAAADALAGWSDAEPCELATEVVAATRGTIAACETDSMTGEARVRVTIGAAITRAEGQARAGPAVRIGGAEPSETGGWVWPAARRAVSQGLHDGLAIDLDVPAGGVLLSPRDGVVVFAGPDGAGIPEPCRVNPGWWRGPNSTVIVRHDVAGQTVYSSHNHVAPQSPGLLGIQPGASVRAGQPLALAGMSGCTSGPHSHFTLASSPTNAFPDLNPFDYLGSP